MFDCELAEAVRAIKESRFLLVPSGVAEIHFGSHDADEAIWIKIHIRYLMEVSVRVGAFIPAEETQRQRKLCCKEEKNNNLRKKKIKIQKLFLFWNIFVTSVRLYGII